MYVHDAPRAQSTRPYLLVSEAPNCGAPETWCNVVQEEPSCEPWKFHPLGVSAAAQQDCSRDVSEYPTRLVDEAKVYCNHTSVLHDTVE